MKMKYSAPADRINGRNDNLMPCAFTAIFLGKWTGKKKMPVNVLTKFYNCIICKAAFCSQRLSQLIIFIAMALLNRPAHSHPNE